MICPKCSNNIDDDSVYCKKCGLKLKEKEIIKPKKEEIPLNELIKLKEGKPLKHVKKSNSKIAIIALIIILSISGVAFGSYKYVLYKKVDTLASNADKEFNKKNYDKSIELYNKVLSYKDDSKMKSKLSLAKIYKKNQGVYNSGLKLMNEKKYLEAIEKFNDIDKDAKDLYKDSQTKIKDCKKQYINSKLSLANSFIQNKNYDKANEHLNEIDKIDNNNSNVKDLRESINKNTTEFQKQEDNTYKAALSNNNYNKNISLTKEGAYNILKKYNLYNDMEIAKMSPLSKEFSVNDKSMYGHNCYYINGKGGNAILFVIDAVTKKIYSCEKVALNKWVLTLKN
ncbi:zinc ribbon domain-containing protein [Clostridium oceanicum]|uniref:Zinc-ribbon domain-containing protein n=1 Tax=Clostridium oceanicum TaxID=1543 RepID=A0ABP3UG69_9CLOT